MWEEYYKLTSSLEFREKWNMFLKTAGCIHTCPLLYQRVTYIIHKEIILVLHPIEDTELPEQASLTYEEKNALYFTAGYVPRALKKKLSRSAHPLKERLICCLTDMMQGYNEDSDDDESRDWIEMIYRGGLTYVNMSAVEYINTHSCSYRDI